MIKDFRHVCILVSDMQRSIGFYKDVLGLKLFKIIKIEGKLLERVFNKKGARLTYAKLRCPGQPRKKGAYFELHCWQRPKALPKKGFNHVSFSITNLDKEYKRMRRYGVKFISKPLRSPTGDTKLCFGYDPDGNLIEFIEDLKK